MDRDDLIKLRETALHARNFEIELVWKRATFFWGLQIALFAALGISWRSSAGEYDMLPFMRVVIAMTGLMLATINYLSFRGSKYWQSAWEGKLHEIDAAIGLNSFGSYFPVQRHLLGAGPYSVTKLAALSQIVLMLLWAFIFSVSIGYFFPIIPWGWHRLFPLLVAATMTCGLLVAIWHCRTSWLGNTKQPVVRISKSFLRSLLRGRALAWTRRVAARKWLPRAPSVATRVETRMQTEFPKYRGR